MATRKQAAKKATKKAAKKAASSTPIGDAAEQETQDQLDLEDRPANGGDAESAELEALIADMEREAGEVVDVTADPPHVAYPDLETQDELDRGGQGELVADREASLVRTALGAIRWAWSQVKGDVDDYQGLCLRFVRMCFNVAALYPSAIVAWVEADRKHRGGQKRGRAGFFRGGEFGHVVLLLGDGLCISTDIRDPGQANRCRVADIEQAWGYDYLGYTDDLNGEIAPRLPGTSQARLTTREWRVRRLRAAISTARKNGNTKAAKKLHDWMNEIRNRQTAR